MLALLMTDEVANVEVSAGEMSARTDEEVYFTLLLSQNDARITVVLDTDDTMLRTGAYSLAKTDRAR